MKNIYCLSIILFLCSFFFPYATNAQRLDAAGNQWNYSGSSFGLSFTFSHSIGEDTLISGQQYKKIYFSDTGEPPWNFYGKYLRQDSTDKVYYLSLIHI